MRTGYVFVDAAGPERRQKVRVSNQLRSHATTTLAHVPVTGSLQTRASVARHPGKAHHQIVGPGTGSSATASSNDFHRSAGFVNSENQPQKPYEFVEYIPPCSLAHSKIPPRALGTRISKLGQEDQNLLQWCEYCPFLSNLHSKVSQRLPLWALTGIITIRTQRFQPTTQCAPFAGPGLRMDCNKPCSI